MTQTWARGPVGWLALVVMVAIVVSAFDWLLAAQVLLGLAGALGLAWATFQSWSQLRGLPREAWPVAAVAAVTAALVTFTMLLDESPIFKKWPLWFVPLDSYDLFRAWNDSWVTAVLAGTVIGLFVVPWTLRQTWQVLVASTPTSSTFLRLLRWAFLGLVSLLVVILLVAVGLFGRLTEVSGADARLVTLGRVTILLVGAGFALLVLRTVRELWLKLASFEPPFANAVALVLLACTLLVICALLAVLPVLFIYQLPSLYQVDGRILAVLWAAGAMVAIACGAVVVPAAATAVWHQLGRLPSGTRSKGVLATVTVVAAGCSAVSLVFAAVNIFQLAGPHGLGGAGDVYTLEVRPVAGSDSQFDITMSLWALGASEPAQLGSRRVSSSSGGGYLVRNVVLPGPARIGTVQLKDAAGKTVDYRLCDNGCPQVMLTFVDFPRGEVWQIRDGAIDKRSPFGRTELVTASVINVGSGTEDPVFSYVREPFNVIPSQVLEHLTELPSVPQAAMLVVLGLVLIVLKGVGSALGGWLVDRVKQLLPLQPHAPAPIVEPTAGVRSSLETARAPHGTTRRRGGHPVRRSGTDPKQGVE